MRESAFGAIGAGLSREPVFAESRPALAGGGHWLMLHLLGVDGSLDLRDGRAPTRSFLLDSMAPVNQLY